MWKYREGDRVGDDTGHARKIAARILDQPQKPEPPSFTDRLLAACAGIAVPTLLVRGLNSDIVSDAGVAEFKARLAQLEVFEVAGAAHMVAGDRNDAFNQGVIGFLQRLP